MRIKKVNDTELFKQKLSSYKGVELGSVDTTLELIQSTLYPDGSKYECIKRFD